MAADPPLRRISTQARAVRTRIAAWVVLLTAVALLGSGLAAYMVESDSIDRRIARALQQEVAELRRLQEEGRDPQTGESFTSARRLMRVALQNNVPEDNETIVAFWRGQPRLVSAVTQSRYRGLATDDRFEQAVRDLMPVGGSRRLGTSLGEVVMTVQPVVGADVEGAYVPVFFLEGERAGFVAVMRTYALVAGAALLVVSAGAWLVSGRLLRPLRQMRTTAQEISDSDLSRRLETTGNDDITELGHTFNAMLERLEHSFAEQRQFLDDAGHELRTPITIVRGHLELLDPDQTTDAEATRDLVLDEIDRMSRLVDDMTVLAKSGRPDFVRPVGVDAGVLTDDVLDKMRALGDREWKLDARAEGTVLADPQRVTQALLQLADNAVQVTGPGEVIAVGSSLDDENVCWWVRDSGPGVTLGERDVIFERFRRGRHSRPAEGSGLGLSIVRAIAVAHDGDVELESAPGEGATFTLRLPASTVPDETEQA